MQVAAITFYIRYGLWWPSEHSSMFFDTCILINVNYLLCFTCLSCWFIPK